ncbi:MAG: hypothetical protein ACJ75H_09375 [Thermoanaerobaculia bacterium]
MKKKTQKPGRQTVTPVQEKDLAVAEGAQHVDNPGQTPMTDGPG